MSDSDVRREYPSQLDAGRAFGTALKLAMAAGLGVDVDQDAFVSGPRSRDGAFCAHAHGCLGRGKKPSRSGQVAGGKVPIHRRTRPYRPLYVGGVNEPPLTRGEF